MHRVRHAADDAVSRVKFVDLYNGALAIPDEDRRLQACAMLLCTCRLKLRKSEFMHLHQGWYDERYGIIQIPEYEPCYCTYCWWRAKENHTGKDEEKQDYDSAYERLTNERYREKNRNHRYVPVAWSPRIVSCLVEYLDRFGSYPHDRETLRLLLKDHIIPNTELFEPNDITYPALRGTGDTFWAFSGLNTKDRAEIGGHRESELGTYSGSSPLELLQRMRVTKGLEPLSLPDFDMITSTLAGHPREPFPAPAKVDPLRNFDPFDTGQKFNPRIETHPADPDGITIDESDFDSLAIGKDLPSSSDVARILEHYNSRLEPVNEDEIADPFQDLYGDLNDSKMTVGQGLLTDFPFFDLD